MRSQICLGTVQFGTKYGINNSIGKTHKKDVFKILDYACQNGLLWIDTAEDYGESQNIIGEYIKSNPNTFKIQSKISRNTIVDNAEENLSRTLEILNIESLDSYLFHDYKKFNDSNGKLRKIMTHLKDKGLCKSVGVSIYNNQEVYDLNLLEFSDEVQLPFNVFDNNNFRSKAIEKLKSEKINVQLRSIYLQGLFFMNEDNLTYPLSSFKYSIKELKNLTSKYSIPLKDLIVSYALYHSKGDLILIGVESLEQLKENLIVFNRASELVPELINDLESIRLENLNLLNPSNWNE